jgi:signal transduction histidine kinase/TolB-like protein/FixJ family two-component response regulator
MRKMPSISRNFRIGARSVTLGLVSWSRQFFQRSGQAKKALSARVDGQTEQPESALYQAQKMEALGRLTGGVAHDFNNLLTVVLGNATALRLNSEARNDAQGVRRALLIEHAAERGGRLAGQLLAFSGKQMLRPETVSVYQVISAMHELLAQAAGETVRVALHSERNLWNCHVDPGQLESAILNLVLNARDAMPVGGNISISCHNRTMTAETARPSKRGLGDFVQTDINDTGVGIAPDLLEKVFEPFFTTKPVGQGSGLGLSQVHGFAGQSGGWVELESAEGRGTTVSLFLPRARASSIFTPEREKEVIPAGTNQTVLVAEPDADLRTTVCEILSQSGYHPLPAANASGALTYLVSDEPIDLLLVEARLPGGVSGIDLARNACRLRPRIHALITAGSTDRSVMEPSPGDKGLQFLSKPYRVSDLVRVVGAALKSDTFSVEREELLAEARVAGSQSRRDGIGNHRLGPNEFPIQGAASRRRSAIRLGVRPFGTAGSADENAFSMGLAEEITRAFSPFSWITCVSPASIAVVADGFRDKASGWAELDLDFLLEASLRRRGNEIRIVARLIDMSGESAMVWERGFDGDMTDVLRLQDRIASETAAHVAPEVLVWKGQEVSSRPQVDPTAYELMLRAIPAIYRLDEPTFRSAGALLERALEMDPSNAACHSWLAHWYLFLIGQGWDTDLDRSTQRANELAQRAVMLDPSDARGFAVAGHVRAFLRKEAPEALSLHERAIELNPNFALAWCYSGLAHSYLGQHTEAIRRIEHARRLSPHDPHGFFFDMAMTMPFLLTGDYERAARVGRRARDAHPGLSSTYKGLLAALGHLRAKREVIALRKKLFKLEPHFSIDDAVSRSPLLLPGDLRRYVDGLRLAGIPERAR